MFKKRAVLKKIDLQREMSTIDEVLLVGIQNVPIDQSVDPTVRDQLFDSTLQCANTSEMGPEGADQKNGDIRNQNDNKTGKDEGAEIDWKAITAKIRKDHLLQIQKLEEEDLLHESIPIIGSQTNGGQNKFKMEDLLGNTQSVDPGLSTHMRSLSSQYTTQRQEQILTEQSEQFADSGVLQVEQDIQGGFSPVRENQDEDYEEQLIRKTLSKQNLDRTGFSGKVKANQRKSNDKLLKVIHGISETSIRRAIVRDLHNKLIKLSQLREQESYLSARAKQKNAQMQLRKTTVAQLQTQQAKLNTIIEFIYYQGDKIQEFDIEAVFRQAVSS